MSKKTSVGEKIRTLRESKGMDLITLSERTQLPLEQLEQIEAGAPLPGLGPIIKIARSLGVRLGTFMDDLEEAGPSVCRRDEYVDSVRFANPGGPDKRVAFAHHMTYHSMSDGKSNKHIEPFVIDINEGTVIEENLSSHEGEEFIYVLEGEIEVDYGRTTYRLQAGDSIHYDPIVKHQVHGIPNQTARILAVVYTPF